MRWRRTRHPPPTSALRRDRPRPRRAAPAHHVADEVSGKAFNPQGAEVKQILDEAESRIFAIAEQGARGAQGWLPVQPLLTQVVERIDELYSRDTQGEVTGVPTGFIDLDKMTSGLQGATWSSSPAVRRWARPRSR
jgi:hypothetical protein